MPATAPNRVRMNIPSSGPAVLSRSRAVPLSVPQVLLAAHSPAGVVDPYPADPTPPHPPSLLTERVHNSPDRHVRDRATMHRPPGSGATDASCAHAQALPARGGISRRWCDIGAISTSRSGLEIAPRSLTPSEAAFWAIATYIPACEARQGHIASARNRPERPIQARARRPAAHRHQAPPATPKPTLGGFWRGVTEVSRGSIGQTEWSHGPFHTHT